MLSEYDKKYLTRYFNDMCEELEIRIPKLIFERSDKMPTKTTKALTELNDDRCIVYFDPNCEMTPETILFLAHELRHVYQYEILDLGEIFDEQQTPDMLSVEEYNLQPLEIDAHAFGEIMMEEITRCTPLWNGFSEKLKTAIKNRKKEILHEEYEVIKNDCL